MKGASPIAHNAATVKSVSDAGAVFVDTDERPWSYAASFSIASSSGPLDEADSLPALVIDLEVLVGAIGIGCMDADLQTYLAPEQFETESGRCKLFIPLTGVRPPYSVMLRNASPDRCRSQALIHGMEVRAVSQRERTDAAIGRMPLRQQGFYNAYPPPRTFAVISWGATATAWLASVLNDCPGVFCVHTQNIVWDIFAGARRLSGLDYIRVVGMQGHGAKLAGDVHGVSRLDVPAIRAFFGDAFRAAIVVRDPRARLLSQLAMIEREPNAKLDLTHLDDAFKDVMRRLRVDGYRERALVHSVSMLNTVVEEQELAPIFKMEDIVSKAVSLERLVRVLSAETIDPPSDWAANATRREPVNQRNRGRQRSLGPRETEIARTVFHPDAIALYEELGYDMGWLR